MNQVARGAAELVPGVRLLEATMPRETVTRLVIAVCGHNSELIVTWDEDDFHHRQPHVNDQRAGLRVVPPGWSERSAQPGYGAPPGT
ncbi:hypothetical protein [Kitasatospora acidiphila]|uniref:hypothetical protein n=1 Tax=Kitasatospora acidiphila TaxID=2567942 RepID=UPI001C67385C|nr:hypothetical protein [Kitasatospora acidiphila]